MFVPKCRHIAATSARTKYAGLKALRMLHAMTAPRVTGIIVPVKNGILASLAQIMNEWRNPWPLGVPNLANPRVRRHSQKTALDNS